MRSEQNRAAASQFDSTTCCIVGGGPAGVMLGFLLARAEVDVIILEKHKDFFRDSRGDTIHPSTLELMNELELLEDFLREPRQEVREITAHFGAEVVHIDLVAQDPIFGDKVFVAQQQFLVNGAGDVGSICFQFIGPN